MDTRPVERDTLDLLGASFRPRDAAFRSNPYRVYSALRSRSPLHYRKDRNDWILTRFSDIAALAKDARLSSCLGLGPLQFSAGDLKVRSNTRTGVARLQQYREETSIVRKLWLANRNPPDHTKLRKLLQPMFSPRYVSGLQTRIETRTNACLDGLATRGELDIVAELSSPLSFAIVADILGVPEEARRDIERSSRESTASLDLDIMPAARERGLLGTIGLVQALRRVIETWRPRATDPESLIGRLLQAKGEGQLNDLDVMAQLSFTIVAGHSTSQHLIGNAVFALLKHPDQCQLLRRQPQLIQTAVDELIRYDTPAQVMERMAVADVEIDDKVIRKGQLVHLVLGAANRDPAIFHNPDGLDITRDPNPHLGFGFGIHHCLGSTLAKLTAQIAIAALVRRFPALSFQPESVQWGDNYLLHGVKSLRVSCG